VAQGGGTGATLRARSGLFPLSSIYDNTSLYQREAVEIRTTLD
jgi:hypothetical protein